METLRVVMASATRRVELEGPQNIVLERLDEMRAWVGMQAQEATEKGTQGLGTPEVIAERATLRTFLAVKRPGNAYESIAVLLAYKRRHEGKHELSADEIRVAMIQAAIRPPRAMGQALADCRRRYGYVEVGSTRGSWRLSSQGETLVEIDLPRANG